jgi:hypothetical protein
MLGQQILINGRAIIQVDIEEPQRKFWRPIVALTVSTHVVAGLILVAFIDEMKGLAVHLILYRAWNLSLIWFPLSIHFPFATHTAAHL